MGLEPYIIFSFLLRVYGYSYTAALGQFIEIFLQITPPYNDFRRGKGTQPDLLRGQLWHGEGLEDRHKVMIDTILISAVEEQTGHTYPVTPAIFDFIDTSHDIIKGFWESKKFSIVADDEPRYNFEHLDSLPKPNAGGGKPSKKQRKKNKKTKKHKRKQNKKGKAKTLRRPRKQGKKTKRKIQKKRTKRKGKKGKKN